MSESGGSIMKRFEEHAKHSGSEVSYDTVVKIEELSEKVIQITTARKIIYTCDFLIYATGNAYRHLGVPGEDRLLGSGVSYCATCDGNFFR
jgi:thioredoxin reductase (NADPH)